MKVGVGLLGLTSSQAEQSRDTRPKSCFSAILATNPRRCQVSLGVGDCLGCNGVGPDLGAWVDGWLVQLPSAPRRTGHGKKAYAPPANEQEP